MTSYDFGGLYGMADHSAGVLYDAGRRDAVVEDSTWGRSKDGTKGQWTVKFRLSTGPMAGMRPLTTNISVSPNKNDGTPNPFGVGRMFRELAALGVPVPDPDDVSFGAEGRPQRMLNGPAPFWVMGWTEDQIAQVMKGRACQVDVTQETWEQDGVTRNKIAKILPPRPGAPTTWPQPQQPAAPQAQGWGAAPQQGYAQPPAAPQQPWGQPQGYPAPQTAQPWGQPQQPAPPQPQAFPGVPGVAGPPAGYAPQAQAPVPGQPVGQPPIPGAPPWAQPPTPGQGGTAEFTPQGQSYQPSHMQPGQPPISQPPQSAQPPGYGAGQPPWQQPQQPQQGFQQPPPQQGPPQPPWPQQGPPQAQQPPPQQGQAPDPNQFPWTQ